MLTLSFHANFAKVQQPRTQNQNKAWIVAFLLSYNYTLVYLGVYLPRLFKLLLSLWTYLPTYQPTCLSWLSPSLLAYLGYLLSYKIHVKCSIHDVYFESHLSLIVNIIFMDFVEKLIFQSCEQNEATILATLNYRIIN